MIQVEIVFEDRYTSNYVLSLPTVPRKGDIIQLEYDLVVNGRVLPETEAYKVKQVVFTIDKEAKATTLVFVKERTEKPW